MKYPGRLIKAGEQDATIVKHIAKALEQRGYENTSAAGVFDAGFKSLVMLFQSQNVDTAGRPLEIDGVVGSMTWGALFGSEVVVAQTGSIGTLALGVALTQLGVMEKPPGSNKGPEVTQYLNSVGLNGGFAWCMAFVYWCFKMAAQQSGAPNPFPKTGGCIDAWRKVGKKAPGRRISRERAMADPSLVKPGQVFILNFGGGKGHTGFVRQSLGGPLQTIEGNSNAGGSREGLGVFELNRRKIPDPKLMGFIDFT